MQRAPGTTAAAAFVGAPTVFLSHAWTYRFRNVVAALRSYVEALPAGSPPPFFWFDCLSIDEHATQTLPQEWWSTTFQDAIRGIGCTLMVLSPWNDPVPLTRAWCLWELYSTDKVGADFRVCLGPDERRAFEAALVQDSGAIFKAFAHINVENAQAGSAEDQAMILGAVERSVGFDGLNGLACARMRAWVVGVARGLLRREGTGIDDRNQIGELFRKFGMHAEALEVHEGTLARPDAEADDTAVAGTLHNMAESPPQARAAGRRRRRRRRPAGCLACAPSASHLPPAWAWVWLMVGWLACIGWGGAGGGAVNRHRPRGGDAHQHHPDRADVQRGGRVAGGHSGAGPCS
eukprot:SAG25_NODE_661_length_6096_cov_3.735201_1_plen_348_part_00